MQVNSLFGSWTRGCASSDHAASGEVEVPVNEVKRQVRVLKSSLDVKLQQHVRAGHPILT